MTDLLQMENKHPSAHVCSSISQVTQLIEHRLLLQHQGAGMSASISDTKKGSWQCSTINMQALIHLVLMEPSSYWLVVVFLLIPQLLAETARIVACHHSTHVKSIWDWLHCTNSEGIWRVDQKAQRKQQRLWPGLMDPWPGLRSPNWFLQL